MSSGQQLAVQPAYRHVPEFAATLGGDVADLGELVGFSPDPEQRDCLDVIFGTDVHDHPAAFEVCCVACRQNLKTGLFKLAGLGWLFLLDVPLVIWSAHEWDTVAENFHDLDSLITNCDWTRRRVKYIHRGERDQEICTRRGARIVFKTRTPGGGRGLSGDRVILDEAWAARKSHIGSLLPTLSAKSLGQVRPQVLYGSSAGHEESAVLRGVRDRGRAGSSPRLAYFEWTAPPPEQACKPGPRGEPCDHRLGSPGCGCDEPRFWQMANPAMGRRISAQHITDERQAMPPAEFGRERMGWWDAPPDEQGQVIPVLAWAACADPASEPLQPVTFAAVFASDRSAAAVALAGRRADGLWHVEVARYAEGTSWVAPWLAARYFQYDPAAVVIDKAAHEGSVIGELEDAGVEVTSPRAGEVAAAYGMFFDAVTSRPPVLRHRGQGDLTAALAGATTRDVGDAGKAWGRRKSGVDISPLVAVTLAMWGHSVKGPSADSEPGAWVI